MKNLKNREIVEVKSWKIVLKFWKTEKSKNKKIGKSKIWKIEKLSVRVPYRIFYKCETFSGVTTDFWKCKTFSQATNVFLFNVKPSRRTQLSFLWKIPRTCCQFVKNTTNTQTQFCKIRHTKFVTSVHRNWIFQFAYL